MLTVSDNHIVLGGGGGGGGGGGDVVGAAVSTDKAIARFDGTSGKLIQSSSVAITDEGQIGVGCVPDRTLVVNGEIGLSYNITTSVHGFKLDGLKLVYFSIATSTPSTVIHEFMGGDSSPKMTITQGGSVGINNVPNPTATLDVNGTSRFRNSTTFNGQIIDNAGSSGTDGQVLKKVGGLVLWANP